MKRKMSPDRLIATEHTDKELWSMLSLALEKKKANKRKREPDMYRNAILELTVQRLNDEITERCIKKIKRRRTDENYHWKDGEHGWSMNASYQDDDILGIDDFFSKLSCKSYEETNLKLDKQVMEKNFDQGKSSGNFVHSSVQVADFHSQKNFALASSCRKETDESITCSLEHVKLYAI